MLLSIRAAVSSFLWLFLPWLAWIALCSIAFGAPVVMDENEASVVSGSWNSQSYGETNTGYNGDSRYTSGNPSSAIEYAFGLPGGAGGSHSVYLTWPDAPGYGSTARVYDGATLKATFGYTGHTDQPTPTLTLGGKPFQLVYSGTFSTAVKVVISADAGFDGLADAVAVDFVAGPPPDPEPEVTPPPANVMLFDAADGQFDYSAATAEPTSGVAYLGDVVTLPAGTYQSWHIDHTLGLTPGRYRIYLSMPHGPPSGAAVMQCKIFWPDAIASGSQAAKEVGASYPIRSTTGTEWGGANWELFADNVNVSDLIQYVTVQLHVPSGSSYGLVDGIAIERVGNAITGGQVPNLWFAGAASSNMTDETGGGGTPGGGDDHTYNPPGNEHLYQNEPPDENGDDPNDTGANPCGCNCDIPPGWPHGVPSRLNEDGLPETFWLADLSGCQELAYPQVVGGAVLTGAHWSYLGSSWNTFPKTLPAGVQLRASLDGFRVIDPSHFEFKFWTRIDGDLAGDGWLGTSGDGQTWFGYATVVVGRNGHINWTWTVGPDVGSTVVGPLAFSPAILKSVLDNPEGLMLGAGDGLVKASTIFSDAEIGRLNTLLLQLQASQASWTDWRGIIGRTADQQFDGEGSGEGGTGTPGGELSIPDQQFSPWSPQGKELNESNLPEFEEPENWNKLYGSLSFPTIGTAQIDRVIWEGGPLANLGVDQIGIKTSELWDHEKLGPMATALKTGVRTFMLLGMAVGLVFYVIKRIKSA